VFCLNRAIPQFDDEKELMAFLEGPNHVVITNRRNLSQLSAGCLDIIREVRTDRKTFVICRSVALCQDKTRSGWEE